MYPHRINLREPWQAIANAPHTTFRRAFRWPTELMPFEQLWLIVGYANAPIQVALNQHQIGSQSETRLPLELNITAQLQSQNLLEITCLQTPATIGSIYLEVRRSVHLYNIIGSCLWNAGKPTFEFHAHIRQPIERKVSVVIRLNDKEVCYQEQHHPEQLIHIMLESLSAPHWLPGQGNQLQNLEIQLLDPSCLLAQHHFQTGFVEPASHPLARTEAFPSDEPVLESPWLADADKQGKLVTTLDLDIPAFANYLWHHPSIRAANPSWPAVPLPLAAPRCS